MKIEWPRIALAIGCLLALGAQSSSPDETAPVPLDPETAKALEVLGEGVVGKALPPPAIKDPKAWLNLGSGVWTYKITHDPREGRKVRVETYEEVDSQGGQKAWVRKIGDQYVEYIQMRPDGSYVKYAEDAPDVGYGTKIDPGILIKAGLELGKTYSLETKLRAYDVDDREKIKFKGTAKSELTYLGAYEVTTPAGTFPAVLVRKKLEIEIGPADVTDTVYSFYSKGVGKVAEIEALHIAALLVYHSTSSVGKLLESWPGKR